MCLNVRVQFYEAKSVAKKRGGKVKVEDEDWYDFLGSDEDTPCMFAFCVCLLSCVFMS